MTERLRRMLRRLPSWFRMRYDRNAVGQQLLATLDEQSLTQAEALLNQFIQDRHLGSADPDQVAWIWTASVDPPGTGETLAVYGGGFQLEEAPDLYTFLMKPADRTHSHPPLTYFDPFLYDPDEQLLYVRKPYGSQNGGSPYVDVVYRSANGSQRQERITLRQRQIWNAFDEFALLAGLIRRPQESNADLRERIWDRFRLPEDMGAEGITARIAQAIGAIRTTTWEDPTQELVIPEPYTLPSLTLVNGRPLAPDQYRIDLAGRLILLPTGSASTATVRYVCGIRIRPAERSDMQSAVAEIRSATPTWGSMRYDRAFWLDSELPMVRLPVTYDAPVDIWPESEAI